MKHAVALTPRLRPGTRPSAVRMLACVIAACCALAVVSLVACRTAAPRSTDVTPVVEVAGCAAWVDGRTCEVGADRALRVWVGPTSAGVRLRAGGQIVTPTAQSAVAGGALWTVTVPAGADAIDLESIDASYTVHYRLPLASARTFPVVEEARRLRAAGKPAEALQSLSGVEAMSGDERAAGHALRGRLHLSLGEVDAALADLREAIARRDPRRASERVVDGVTLAFALNQRTHRFAEAKAVLADAAARTGEYPEGRALVPYHRALVAYETGDMRATLLGLDEAALRAARLGDVPLVRAAKGARALALLALGRRREAIDILVALRRERGTISDCAGVDLAINLSWVWASCGEDDALALCGVPADDALREAERAALDAIEAFPALCPDPHLTANALVNGALVRLLRGDARGTLALLERSRKSAEKPSAAVELFWLDLENRALLASGDARRALAGFERERARADALLATPMRWRAEIGIAEARERTGDTEGAIAAYDRAATASASESLSIPLGEGRVSFLAEREQATVRHVDLLLRAGRDEDALSVVRRARLGVLEPLEWARNLARLDPSARRRWDESIGNYREQRTLLEADAAEEWSLPRDEWQRATESRRAREGELRAVLDEALSHEALARAPGPPAALRVPESGETLLVYHRAREQWIGFARTASGVVVRSLGPVESDAGPDVLARTLLEPFAAEIEASRRVTVLPTGALRAVDFHALPWRGAPLIERVSVAYGLDLPVESAPPAAGQGLAGHALVVGDPTGDLVAARTEAEVASGALRRAGWAVEAKVNHDAQGDAVRAALASTELVHYAGHGVFAGPDGWESALPLADSGTLSVGDLLALPRVPRLVVLAGCETARSGDGKSAAGLGLAQAFLVAGAAQVLASGRTVDDRMAERAMAMLYASPPGSGQTDLVERLAEAQRALWRLAEPVGWQDLRVLVR